MVKTLSLVMTLPLVALTGRAAAGVALRQGGIPVPQVQLSAVILNGSMTVPVFWGKYSKGVPFLLTYKEGKGKLIIRTSRAGGLVKLFFKVSKAVAS